MSATYGAGTAYLSGAPEFTPVHGPTEILPQNIRYLSLFYKTRLIQRDIG
jgi:hypothetical protein